MATIRYAPVLIAGLALGLCQSAAHAAGPVFHSLFSFGGNTAGPFIQLTIDSRGVLYSATRSGGNYQGGAVFALAAPASAGDPWTKTVLWNVNSSDNNGQVPPVQRGAD